MTSVRDLDGSNAGGQFVRTALALSILRNDPVRIEHVRGDRSTPGLRHQHLAVLETLAELCEADVSGAELGAETIEFDPDLESTEGATDWRGRGPGTLPGGSYAVDIGTAGSATLLFDTLLPLASVLESQLSVTVTGGTDVPFSPPLDYSRHVKLPLLRRFGLTAAYEDERRGFTPDGGGRVTLRLAPSPLEPIDLTERGDLAGVRLYSIESESLADADVAHRQVEGALERLALEEHGLDVLERRETTVASSSPGTAIVLRLDHGTGLAGFAALGEPGKPAERVGEDAADALNRFLEDGDGGARTRGGAGGQPTDGRSAGGRSAPIDRYLADQVLVYLGLRGGRVRVPEATDHVASSCELLEAFGATVDIVRDGGGGGDGNADADADDDDETGDESGGAVVSVESPVDL